MLLDANTFVGFCFSYSKLKELEHQLHLVKDVTLFLGFRNCEDTINAMSLGRCPYLYEYLEI